MLIEIKSSPIAMTQIQYHSETASMSSLQLFPFADSPIAGPAANNGGLGAVPGPVSGGLSGSSAMSTDPSATTGAVPTAGGTNPAMSANDQMSQSTNPFR